MRNSARSRGTSVPSTVTGRCSQLPSPALRTCTTRADALAPTASSGSTCALVITMRPSPTMNPVPLSRKRGLSVAR